MISMSVSMSVVIKIAYSRFEFLKNENNPASHDEIYQKCIEHKQRAFESFFFSCHFIIWALADDNVVFSAFEGLEKMQIHYMLSCFQINIVMRTNR